MFPVDFEWYCDCDPSEGGFPGCDSLECFITRVYLAILDFHQMRESKRKKDVRVAQVEGESRLLLIRPEKFSRGRMNAFRSDLATAASIIRDYRASM
jgi:hypothetical protein